MSENTPKSTKELRKFGLVMTVPFAIIGGLMMWRGKALAPYFLALGGFFLVSGLLIPTILRPIEKAWMKFAEVLSVIMTRVILTLTFFLVITPLGLLMRMMGKDLLKMKRDPQAASYWVPVASDGPCSRPDKPY